MIFATMTSQDLAFCPDNTCVQGTWGAPGASCTLSLVFTPHSTGTLNSTVTVQTQGHTAGDVALSVSGIGL